MKRRILMIDDELVPGATEPGGNYMWYYAQILKENEYDVQEVSKVEEALSAFADPKKSFDIVLLDVMMPHGKVFGNEETLGGLRTGVLALRKLSQSHPKMPVVILTNVANPETLQQLTANRNVAAILFKPDCTPGDLLAQVDEILGERHACAGGA